MFDNEIKILKEKLSAAEADVFTVNNYANQCKSKVARLEEMIEVLENMKKDF